MGALVFLFFILQLTATWTAVQPVQKCLLSDSVCLTKAAQDVLPTFISGFPEIGVETLDPLYIDLIQFDLAGLTLTLKDSNIKGIRNGVIDKVSFDTSKKIMHLNLHSNVTLKAKYKAGGRLLILPITGDGNYTLKLRNLRLSLTIRYDVAEDKNGKDILELKSYEYTCENKENSYVKLTNLFNGNKALSDTMHNFINENWIAIFQEFARPVFEKPVHKIHTAVKKYLESQPLENIVQDYVHKH